MSEIQKPKIYNVDRYVLATVLHKPQGKGQFPAVILFPGFLAGKDDKYIVSLADQLAENGIVALRFDPAGFGESEGTIAEDYRLSVFMNDIDIMWSYLKHQPFVNDKVIGLYGHSLGGTAAICFGGDYPTGISAIAAVAPPQTFESGTLMKLKFPEWEKSGVLVVEREPYGKMEIPYAFVKDARLYSALESVKAVQRPILVVTGTMDTHVSPKETRELFLAANEPKELVEMLGMDHVYWEKDEELAKVNEAVVGFFRKNLR